ncbi:hypothetical protein PJK54_11735 [Cobetia sp. MMG027]|uniref:hypothetical protein n=1 Tax=Cobetia sp. MMG027 TaxID=3021980 RepID=UPI0022FEB69C|nr:hypothetical protein [Cobetia sp. MMG027]MDA5564334.1 hypothetical protein [Cobetia sp. MMG027]
MIITKADLEFDRHKVESAVGYNRRWGQSHAGLYYDEELAGPDGMSVMLFITDDTTTEQIQQAERAARDAGDVVRIQCLKCPAEWLTEEK